MSGFEIDLDKDLKDRWRPSVAQIELADALLESTAFAVHGEQRGVYTGHLLLNKTFGMWTASVEVRPLDGLFLAIEALQGYVYDAAKCHFNQTGFPVTGGYTRHPEPGHWAVFEDIGACFPRR